MVTSSKHASLGSYLLALQVRTLACVWHRHTVTVNVVTFCPCCTQLNEPWVDSVCISNVYKMEEADSAPNNDRGLLLAGLSASPGKTILE